MLVFSLLSTLWVPSVLGQKLDVWVKGERKSVASRQHDSRALYRLRDLASILGLQLNESGSTLQVVGPRGDVLLNAGRPLVRSGDHYILLSTGVWRRESGDWYVPIDFLQKVLANIVSQRLDRRTDGSFRVIELQVNEVAVGMTSYPDHLSVAFDVSRAAEVEVREFESYLMIEFGEYLVRPVSVETSPDPRLVTAVEFSRQEAFGSFRVIKGPGFSSFRQHYLRPQSKLIIEVLGVAPTTVAGTSPDSGGEPAVVDPVGGGDPAPATVRRRDALQEAVVIDPGHGGLDYGVDGHHVLPEKGAALGIARKLESELKRSGVKARLTRVRDVQLSTVQRSAVSNFYHCRLFIAIHLGGAPSGTARGPVVYVYDPPWDAGGASGEEKLVSWEEGQAPFLRKSRQVARAVQTELNGLFETENEVTSARLGVLAPVRAPAIVVEAGFLTNSDDRSMLASPDFQQEIAGGISRAIRPFLK